SFPSTIHLIETVKLFFQMVHRICFSVFDDTVGTRAVHFENLTEEEAQKVSIRMLMGAAATDFLRESSAVMPLHDVGGVAYSFFFGVPCKSKRSPITMACLTYIIPEEMQSQLYTKVPVFNYNSSNVSKQISGLLLYEPGYEMDDSLRARISNWGNHIKTILESKQDEAAGVQTIEIDRTAASPYFFMRLVNKGQDRVVHALINGKPIIVVCSSEMVKPFLSSLQAFQPRRELLVSLFPSNYVPPDQFDVLFANADLISNYPDSVICDLTVGVAKGGEESDFSKNVIRKLQEDVEASGHNHKTIIDSAILKLEGEVIKIIRYSGTSIISQYYALTTNPKQQFSALEESEIDIAFQIAFTRYPEYASSIDKLYQEVTGKKRKFNI
ncbi:MAG: hypothetical protein KGD64_14860, partial [Candidatus Heimdallarchaeota archaeon]|nr:hypothetical protein [Candidatus Heimdallarchaeota archaeon]